MLLTVIVVKGSSFGGLLPILEEVGQRGCMDTPSNLIPSTASGLKNIEVGSSICSSALFISEEGRGDRLDESGELILTVVGTQR